MWLNMWIKNRWLWASPVPRGNPLLCGARALARHPRQRRFSIGLHRCPLLAAWRQPLAPADLAVAAQAAGFQVTAADFVTNPSVYSPPALRCSRPWRCCPGASQKRCGWPACSLFCCGASRCWRERGRMETPRSSLLLSFAPLHTGLGKGSPACWFAACFVSACLRRTLMSRASCSA